MSILVTKTRLPGVLVLKSRLFADDRGHFQETWSRRNFLEVGIDVDFVQDNHSLSLKAGTLRGLHFQSPPHAQAKLVRCTAGAIFDVAIDVRRGSPQYGQSFGIELTPESATQIFIPAGFLHGFLTLKDKTEVQYKCSDYYNADADGSVRWDSAGIDWPWSGQPVLSTKDEAAILFSEFVSPFDSETSR